MHSRDRPQIHEHHWDKGLDESAIATLKALGAVENNETTDNRTRGD